MVVSTRRSSSALGNVKSNSAKCSPIERKEATKRAVKKRRTSANMPRKDENVSENKGKNNEPLNELEFYFAVENESPSIDEPVQEVEKFSPSTLFSRSYSPRQIIGRVKEREKIESFIDEMLREDHSSHCKGSLYISGNPGTGKTALLTDILKQRGIIEGGNGLVKVVPNSSVLKKVSVVFLNCISAVTDPKHIFQKLLDLLTSLNPQVKVPSSCKGYDGLKECLTGKYQSRKFLFVLDELDSLLTNSGDILYKLFELPFLLDSCCYIIGIANALDLTDHFLPRLQRKNYQPETLHFAPYSVAEMIAILKDRLSDENCSSMELHPMALELCARKVAGMGDFRKALDILGQAFELALKESSGAKSLNRNTSMVKVSIPHIVKVMENQVQPSVNKKLLKLNVQAKLILFSYVKAFCPFILYEQEQREKENILIPVSLSQLYNSYLTSCGNNSQGDPLSKSEFIDVCNTIEAIGCVSIESVQEGKRKSNSSSSSSSSSSGARCLEKSRQCKFNISPRELQTFLKSDPYLCMLVKSFLKID